jgi:hypothetical protein
LSTFARVDETAVATYRAACLAMAEGEDYASAGRAEKLFALVEGSGATEKNSA